MKLPQSQNDFEKLLVRKYFESGSVEAVLNGRDSYPISSAGCHRILNKFGVVKRADPNNSISELIDFVEKVLNTKKTIHELGKLVPDRFKTSTKTIYRAMHFLKEGVTRRVGVALIISPEDNLNKILIAEDYSTPRLEYGKISGKLTIPIGFAKKRDSNKTNVKRILQWEVFTDRVIDKEFPVSLLEQIDKPLFHVQIVDVDVSVFRVVLPKDIKDFSSFKLKNFRFVDLGVGVKQLDFRLGVIKVIERILGN